MTLKSPNDIHNMNDLRIQIDALDREIITALAKRQSYIDRAAQIKPAAGLPARIEARVDEVINNVAQVAQKTGFDPELARRMWAMMIDEMIAREEKAMGSTAAEPDRKAST